MPPLALLWVWMCAVLNCAGWGLSALHDLNGPGYAAVLALGGLALLRWRKVVIPSGSLAFHEARFVRHVRQPLPLAFIVLTGLMILGGMLYAPANYDGLACREPRILHWLAADQWHWIHTVYSRLNTPACGFEWVATPLILFSHHDRLLFLINVVSFLLLPGLVFSVFTRLGVRPRVAWNWMWIVPTGYCFLLAGGSAGNDLFGAPLALAAVDLALRARTSHRARDFFGAILAAALLTSASTSNLPLLLVWGVAIFPAGQLVFRWPFRLAVVGLVAVACSCLPTAMLNQRHGGDWTGGKTGGESAPGNPPLRLAANVLRLSLQNLTPPLVPLAGQWHALVANNIPLEPGVKPGQTGEKPAGAEFHLDELPTEEPAGLGFGVCLLLVLSGLAAARRGALFPAGQFATPLARWLTALRWLPLISLLVWLSESEVYPISPILAPYYALLLPAWLAGPAQARVVRQRWWRYALTGALLLAALLLVRSPPRPLFPAVTVFSALHARHPDSRLLARADTIYSLNRQRSDAFAPVLAELPPDLKILGVFTYDDPETSLWRPFGSRRILQVRPEDTAASLKAEGIDYVLLNSGKFPDWFQAAPDAWVRQLHATVVKKIPLTLRAFQGPVDWWLVKLP